MRSLYEKLQSFNYCTHHEQEYIAIPALASVSLLNLQDQYNSLMDSDVKFTPQNVKANKANILNFLQQLYYYPEKNKELLKCTPKAYDIMVRRSEGIDYIGDLFESE